MKSWTKQRSVRGVAVAGVVLVFDDLLHRPAGVDAERLQFDLHDGHAVDEQDDVVAVVAVVGVDAELVDDLEGVLAPVLDVDQRVVERRAVVAGEGCCGSRSVRAAVKTSGVTISSSRRWNSPSVRRDAVECLELLAEVCFQRGAVADVGAVLVLQVREASRSARLRVGVRTKSCRPCHQAKDGILTTRTDLAQRKT